MILGFTGTRSGLAPAQEDALCTLLVRLGDDIEEFHHGSAVGADHASAMILVGLKPLYPRIRVHAYPSTLRKYVSWAALEAADVQYGPQKPLERNLVIAEKVKYLVACPRLMVEERRSGTWFTVRRCREFRRRINIVWPDGRVTGDKR